MDTFWFSRLVKENSVLAFYNLASDLASYLDIHVE